MLLGHQNVKMTSIQRHSDKVRLNKPVKGVPPWPVREFRLFDGRKTNGTIRLVERCIWAVMRYVDLTVGPFHHGHAVTCSRLYDAVVFELLHVGNRVPSSQAENQQKKVSKW